MNQGFGYDQVTVVGDGLYPQTTIVEESFFPQTTIIEGGPGYNSNVTVTETIREYPTVIGNPPVNEIFVNEQIITRPEEIIVTTGRPNYGSVYVDNNYPPPYNPYQQPVIYTSEPPDCKIITTNVNVPRGAAVNVQNVSNNPGSTSTQTIYCSTSSQEY